ncbi:MAG: molybdenum cofactor biosynthesis protein MoaE [Bdellovibrionales bacterium]|jgi:molybdopterin synthase catalytic subunit|nr:molybdenum cofactor biosynthesis protein MoaE [Bdellovibrionales bacterium]MBT3524854.1 molybdenum cofactor biosynthesis protein MoaE [Bdellovibrionales bacterium]MBT7669546.1 molybdenum cofactor biosynthesis protein MoaE [Bdellovibrionales bacterium]MBT7767217.1 molybdenum cofactor biosynthesis protein MoaE [Bdellovibrionales bacterium]
MENRVECKIKCEITSSPLDISKAYEFVSDPAAGAVNLFVGEVRNHHNGKSVEKLFYDCYPEMGESVLTEICQTVAATLPLCGIFVQHRYGELAIGESSVLIMISSGHRDESFKACRYIIERIKLDLPVWKQEFYLGEEAPLWVKCQHHNHHQADLESLLVVEQESR